MQRFLWQYDGFVIDFPLVAGEKSSLNNYYLNGKVKYINKENWISRFFPGTSWLLYELTNDEACENHALKYTEVLDSVKYLTQHHDIGFMIECSYRNSLD